MPEPMTPEQAVATIIQEFHIALTAAGKERLHQILRACVHRATIEAVDKEIQIWGDKSAKIQAILDGEDYDT